MRGARAVAAAEWLVVVGDWGTSARHVAHCVVREKVLLTPRGRARDTPLAVSCARTKPQPAAAACVGGWGSDAEASAGNERRARRRQQY